MGSLHLHLTIDDIVQVMTYSSRPACPWKFNQINYEHRVGDRSFQNCHFFEKNSLENQEVHEIIVIWSIWSRSPFYKFSHLWATGGKKTIIVCCDIQPQQTVR